MNEEIKNVKGLYVHIPFCSGKCFYCAFYSIPYQNDSAQRYLRAVPFELKQYPRFNPETIYFGGGTPSVLSSSELENLCNMVKSNISTANLKEWTVEANPESLTADKLAVLAKNGVNRISVGAQSFDDSALKWLGRRHKADQITEAVKLIRAAGFHNFGLDLIACIPGFAGSVWKKTLASAVKLNPMHISVYALTAEEGSRLAEIMTDEPFFPLCHSRANGNPSATGGLDSRSKAGMTLMDDKRKIGIPSPQIKLLSEDEELETLAVAEQFLTNEGYQRYEISNYAKKNYECLHNLSCWRGEEYLGLGTAASSYVGVKRWTNSPDLEKYIAALENSLPPPCSIDPANERTRQIEKVIFGLRMSEGIAEHEAKPWQTEMLHLRDKGLLNISDGRWRLTEYGKNLADFVGAELLASGAEHPT